MTSEFQRASGTFGAWRNGRLAKKVLVLGGTGMLGHALLDVFSNDPICQVSFTHRRENSPGGLRLDVQACALEELSRLVAGFDAVLNAIGITKPYIRDDHAGEVARALQINALFPHRLAQAAEAAGIPVLQIATDCVFQGASAEPYAEDSPHDATDVYGKTKSLGEVASTAMGHLRASIIGPERARSTFLWEWFRGQPRGAKLRGFEDHWWNGVTTRSFARVCLGIIKKGIRLPGKVHLVPADRVTKYELLQIFREVLGREDLVIEKVASGKPVNRLLGTKQPDINRLLWQAAGYPAAPTIRAMVQEAAHAGTN